MFLLMISFSSSEKVGSDFIGFLIRIFCMLNLKGVKNQVFPLRDRRLSMFEI